MSTELERSSSMHRRALCPGSARAEATLPEKQSEYSEAGTRLHDLLAGKKVLNVTPEEEDIAVDLTRMAADAEEAILKGATRSGTTIEGEYFVLDEKGNKVVVGHPDIVIWFTNAADERCALILDYKTGFNEVDSAEENEQLLCYALGVYDEAALDRVYAKILQRFTKKEDHNVVEYDADALNAARGYILDLLAAGQQPDVPRTPSEPACRYCKALGTSRCPETSQIVQAVDVEILAPITPEEMARRLDLFDLVEAIIKKQRAEFEAFAIANPDAIPGYYMKPGRSVRSIPDTQAAFAAVENVIGFEKFNACTKVGLGKLETAIGEATDLKGIALEKKIEEILGAAIVTTTGKESLTKLSKKQLKAKEGA